MVASAQSKTLKVSGTVKDAHDKGLAGVSILVRTADGTFGGVSGRNGEYEVNFTAIDTVKVSYSYVGYQTYTFSTLSVEDIRRDVVLTDKSHTLGEVEVTASSINMKDDHVTYMPTKKQVNGANNGVLLLFNMMIPQLKVSPMENSVATSDQTSLGIFIDERQADANELARLRPKDIARVEYYEMPTGVFARSGIDRALNIVTKKYTSGGYVDVRTNTKVIYPQGDYSVQASFDKGNVNMLVMAGSNVSKTDTEGIDIVLALDVSTSMLARDFTPDRIEAAKNIAIEFISQRPSDRIGVVVFAGESYTQSPLTTDRATLINLIKEIECGLIDDGTAIGNGLANAVARLKDSQAKSRVVILLTDGVNNRGEIAPLTAAEIARTYGIRVYTLSECRYRTSPWR